MAIWELMVLSGMKDHDRHPLNLFCHFLTKLRKKQNKTKEKTTTPFSIPSYSVTMPEKSKNSQNGQLDQNSVKIQDFNVSRNQ